MPIVVIEHSAKPLTAADVSVVGDIAFMTGPALDRFSNPAPVRGEVVRAVDAFYAVTGLLWPSLRKPAVGAVYREEEGGCQVLSYAPVAP